MRMAHLNRSLFIKLVLSFGFLLIFTFEIRKHFLTQRWHLKVQDHFTKTGEKDSQCNCHIDGCTCAVLNFRGNCLLVKGCCALSGFSIVMPTNLQYLTGRFLLQGKYCTKTLCLFQGNTSPMSDLKRRLLSSNSMG